MFVSGRKENSFPERLDISIFPEGPHIEGFVQGLKKTNKEKKIVIKTSSSFCFDRSSKFLIGASWEERLFKVPEK